MNLPRLLTDLSTWWMQTALLGAAAALLAAGLRLPAGRAKLFYWQTVLLACLLLPFLATRPNVAVTVVPSRAAVVTAIAPTAAMQTAAFTIPWVEIALCIAAAGTAVRLAMFLGGFVRLSRYRNLSVPLKPESSWAPEADIRLSDSVPGPVTFGILKPVILLPANFPGLPSAGKDAILCHEVLHIRRRDWLFAICEDLIRTTLWFQPAIWWIVNEIQLAREQTVDAAVVSMLNQREEYVDALLTAAGAFAMTDLAGAPLFLRKRQLKQRLVSILKEHSMSKTQRLSTFAAGFTLLAVSCWVVTTAFPLAAATQFVNDALGVTVNTNGSTLIHRSGIDYPLDLVNKGIQGSVQVQVRVDGAGKVADAAILSGPDELRKVVLQSVLEWHFSPTGGATRTVAVSFTAPPAGQDARAAQQTALVAPLAQRVLIAPNRQLTVTSITVTGISDEASRELLSRLPVREGDNLTQDVWARTSAAVKAFDEHLNAVFLPTSPDRTRIMIVSNVNGVGVSGVRATPGLGSAAESSGAAEKIFRIDGSAQAANLIRKVTPVYPPLAKAARIQGIVRFDATIAKDGTVDQLRLVSGPPLLVQAATFAVQQWQFKPTLLNGEPANVVTTIDVNFSISD